MSGRRPRKEHFEDKVGAGAAIGAVIENSRRLFAAPLDVDEGSGQTREVVGEGDVEVSMPVPMTARTNVELVDVVTSARPVP